MIFLKSQGVSGVIHFKKSSHTLLQGDTLKTRNPSFGYMYPDPYTIGSRGASISSILFMAYCLWKAKSSHFPSRSVSQPTTTPLFFFGAYLCICQNGFLLLVHNAHTGLRRSFTVFSCIYYIWLGLWVYHVESSAPRRPQINLVSWCHSIFYTCICIQKWNGI